MALGDLAAREPADAIAVDSDTTVELAQVIDRPKISQDRDTTGSTDDEFRPHPDMVEKRNVITLARTVLVPLTLGLLLSVPTRANDDPPADEPISGMQTEVTVDGNGRVNLFVEDAALSTVLRMLAVQSGRNIIASPGVTGSVTANLYEVTFDEALQAILMANRAGYRMAGDFIYVHTLDELDELAAAAAARPVTRVFRLSYVTAADAGSYIKPLLGSDEKLSASPDPATKLESDSGDGGGQASAAQDFLIVTAHPDKLREIERIIAKIDVRPQQVLIDATILRAELSDENALGIDFAIVGGVDLEMLGATSNGITDLTLGPLPQDRLERFNSTAMSDFAGDVPDGGLTVGILKDKVALFLRALEQVTNTTVLANPKVLGLNKQKGQVIVGRRDGFMTTTVTETQAMQSIEFLETGTQLIFRPFIGDDGYIRMELHPEDSVGYVNAQGLPSEQTTEVTTNVLVRDGETILIGGLFREVTTDARRQVPWLGNLPGLGPLFRSNADSSSREEVIILLTVHVVKDQRAYAAASAECLDDLERMRVGLRRGLMWHGRERVAQRQYGKAIDAYNRNDLDKAVWHLNMALSNSATLLPAIHLKERILQQRTWDEDGSGGRTFLYRLIAAERGDVRPPLGRPWFGAPSASEAEGGFEDNVTELDP